MLLSDLFKNGISFRAYDLSEYHGPLNNPDRGWFHMYTFDVGEGKTDAGSIVINDDPSSDLVLLLIALRSAYKFRDKKTETAKTEIEALIERFHAAGKDIILRVVYDTCGHALESEPYDLEEVLQDAGMVGEILKNAGEKVFVYQGLLVGNWGEMHTSKYADGASFNCIYEKIKQKSAGADGDEPGCFFAVRRPDIHRMLDNSDGRLGIFDDAVFGSESDMGTYRDAERDPQYESKVSLHAPNGGEAIYGGGYIDHLSDKDVISFLEKKKVTYLNRDYDLKLIDKLKRNEELYTAVDSRLGYRYIVTYAGYQKKDRLLKFTVKNLGFAPVYRSTRSFITARDANGQTEVIPLDLDLRTVGGCGESADVSVIMHGIDEMRMPVRVSLETVRSYDGKTIRYANPQTEDGSVLLGEFR